MVIKVLGSGCKNCAALEKNIAEALASLQLDHEIEKVTDYSEIVRYGVLKTPGLVFDEKLVSYGKVTSVDEIKKLLVEDV